MARQLTKKQRGFVKDYLKTGNATLAVKRNYKKTTDLTARTMGSENLTKPNIIKSLQEALPDELLSKVHLEGLNATYNEVPDYSVRHKYLDSAYKIKGAYVTEEKPTSTTNNLTQIIIHNASDTGHISNSEAEPSMASVTRPEDS